MDQSDIRALFETREGQYRFARWGRPLAPVVFGVEDKTLNVVKGALQAVASLAGQQVDEMDPELGVNCMVFFFRDWEELAEVPDLDRLIPELGDVLGRLKAADAVQYRAFRFDDKGAIQAAFVFVRMAGDMAKLAAEEVALLQAVQVILLWGDRAFEERSPLVRSPEGAALLRPDVAAVIRAAYDPVMPASTEDDSHAIRLAARLPGEL